MRIPWIHLGSFLREIGVTSLSDMQKITPEEIEAAYERIDHKVETNAIEHERWEVADVLEKYGEKPAQTALRDCHDGDFARRDECKELQSSGLVRRFDRTFYNRTRAYLLAGESGLNAKWFALNDLCNDATLGRCARIVRFGWVKALRRSLH